MALDPGAILAERYTILRAIKTGGMGSVYEAVDARLADTPCAVKEMLEQFLDGDEADQAIRRFSDEMRFLATLSHPHIPRVRDFFSAGRLLYIVMDLIRGDNLEQELTERMALTGGPFSPELAVDDAIQVLGVLQYLHELTPPVVHRDIKPANLIREHATRALKLVDFGLVRAVTGSARTHTIVGTLSYAALEQLQGHAEPRSDLYGLGATMHHLLTGIPPRPLDLPPLRQAAPELDPRLAAIVDHALAAHPEDRFASARDMRVALQAWRESARDTVVKVPVPIPVRPETLSSARPTGPVAVPAEVPRRRASWWMPASAAVAAGMVVFMMMRGGSPPPGPSPPTSAPIRVVVRTVTPANTPSPAPAAASPASPAIAAASPTAEASSGPVPIPNVTRADATPRPRPKPKPSRAPARKAHRAPEPTPYVVNLPPTPAAAPAPSPAPPLPVPLDAPTVQVVSAEGQDAHLKLQGFDYWMHLPEGWRFGATNSAGRGVFMSAGDDSGDGIMLMVQADEPVLYPRIQQQLVLKLQADGWQMTPGRDFTGAWISFLKRPEPEGMRHGRLVVVPQPMPGASGRACLFLAVEVASLRAVDHREALRAMTRIVRIGMTHPIR